MKAQKTHQHQMLERIFDFGLNHLDLFPGGSVAHEVIDTIGLLVKKLNGHAWSHVAGAGQLKTTTISHNEASLGILGRHWLLPLGSTAHKMKWPELIPWDLSYNRRR